MDKTLKLEGPMPAPTPVGGDRTIALPSSDDATQHTLKAASAPAPQSMQVTDDNVFVLKGERYDKVSCLSDNSGEAQVFLVYHNGKEYVLKVYYPNFTVNKKLLQVIRSFHFEMIVNLIDYGKTYVDAKYRYYELMEYLEGGTLQDFKLGNDLNQFRRLALQAAAALAYCHRYNILHKDVKPTNFFFRDKGHKELVLGDFGISSFLDPKTGLVRTTQARTPIYAAPEMYADVIDGEVEISAAADYYSLGITLLALWLGETPLSSNERNMMKQKNEGRLPRLGELPESVKRIVQGLTAVNVEGRWTYDEVERWFKGEDVKVDLSSAALRYKSFIVDPERNLVANNLHELIPMLIDNERLAINYLYSGRIANWLESCGNQKLTAVVKDIVTNKFPVNSRVGLMAAVYAMEPTYPYKDIKGNLCDDVHSISLALLSNQDIYAMKLQDPNDDLFLWLDVHTKCDIDRLRSYFKPEADAHVAVMRMVFEIDPDIPFLGRHPSMTLEEIFYSFGHSNLTDDDWHSLTDGRLLSWMYAHEDVMACESTRILTEGKPYSESLAYKVIYNLDREAAYDLREASTPEAVGEVIAQRLMQLEHVPAADFEKTMADIASTDGRFAYYAQIHGWGGLQEEARRCFDLKSPENRDRLGVYDLRTAMYRFCRILGTTPGYLLPNGQVLTDSRQLTSQLASQIHDEIRGGALAQWLTVFYHEDPTRDFSEPYSYERALAQWLETIGKFDEHHQYFFRYNRACQETRDRTSYVRKRWMDAYNRERIMRYIFYGVSILWVLLVVVFGREVVDYVALHPYVAVLLPVGGMSAVIMGTRAYFRGYGSSMSLLWGALGLLSSLVPVYILKFVAASVPMLSSVVIIMLTLAYVYVCHRTDYSRDRHSDKNFVDDVVKTDDVNTSLLDPLYYTFRTKSARYSGSKFGLLDDVDNQVNSFAGESVIHYLEWSFMVLLLIVMLLLHCL